jgi:PAS domain S-box-containing protein
MIEQTDGIGQHQKVLEALQHSELRYRRLFESAREGILIFDAADQKITDANPAMVELLGYSRDELLGKDLWELGMFKDRVKGHAAIQQLLATGHLTYEDLSLETKAGENRDVEFTASVYEEGTRRIIQCDVRDVTEHKNIETVQREQAALLTVAQRIGRMGNWSLDLISGGLVWSEATCELFGITRAEFAHTYDHFYSFILAEDGRSTMPLMLWLALPPPFSKWNIAFAAPTARFAGCMNAAKWSSMRPASALVEPASS